MLSCVDRSQPPLDRCHYCVQQRHACTRCTGKYKGTTLRIMNNILQLVESGGIDYAADIAGELQHEFDVGLIPFGESSE